MGDDPQATRCSLQHSGQGPRHDGELYENDEADAEHAADLLRYLVELTDRERWIIDEMKRRGYLPPFPGEGPSL